MNDFSFLKNIDGLKAQIDALQPVSADQHGRIMQKFRLDWNYHSNAIEGNKLSYGETVALLMEGITAKGKPLKDHLDIEGHNEAIDFLLSIVKDTRPISEAEIRELHQLILKKSYKTKAQSPSGLPVFKTIQIGVYKTESNHVETATGAIHYYATPEETPAKMQNLMAWLKQTVAKNEEHPLIIASVFHHRFVSIHPFDDGNGRMSRLLMNLILMQYDYPPVVIKTADRKEYFAALSRADNKELQPFIEFIGKQLEHSLSIYLKGAKGESIDEPDDIDKEIALLKASIRKDIRKREARSDHRIKEIILNLIPFFERIQIKCKQLDELFFQNSFSINFIKESRLEYEQDNDGTIINEYETERKVTKFTSVNELRIKIPNPSSFDTIAFSYSWRKLKSFPDIYIYLHISVNFEQNSYKISSTRSSLGKLGTVERLGTVEKFYNESLTKQEQNQIIKDNIKSIINEIKNHSK